MATTPFIPSVEETIRPPLPSIEWLQCLELGYEDKKPSQVQVCFHCGNSAQNLSRCAQCQVATYCSRDCQVKSWKAMLGHKMSCPSFKRVGRDMILKTEEEKKEVRGEVYGRVRFYVCPYAIHKQQSLGRGFLFLQSDCTLAEVSLTVPMNAWGHPIGMRSLLIHFLTVGEYDSEICRDDFELAQVRGALRKAVEDYDPESMVVVLMRFRCGHVALGIAELVPDYGICKNLGKDYYGDSTAGAIQLNIDDI